MKASMADEDASELEKRHTRTATEHECLHIWCAHVFPLSRQLLGAWGWYHTKSRMKLNRAALLLPEAHSRFVDSSSPLHSH